jgi:serpin B
MNPRIGHSLLLLGLYACGDPTEPEGSPPLLTELPRVLSPAEVRIVDAANAFGFNLMRQVGGALPADSNVFLSPLSASFALGMTLNGAAGETYEAMRGTLGMAGLTEADINQGYRDLMALLAGLDARTEMIVANSMWGSLTLPLAPEFTQAGRDYFDAEIRTLDFAEPTAAEVINGWVEDKTRGRIPRLLDRIDPDVVLFLINAIYFKGRWRSAFAARDTRDGVFHGADGVDRSLPLMRLEKPLLYSGTADYDAVDLLYGNGAFAMTVLLPREGRTPSEVLGGMDPAAWDALTEQFHETQVTLTLPRFRLEYSRGLNGDLAALGMEVAFDPTRADFARIAEGPPRDLYISRVQQKTFVEVNEEGTEAAAATSVEVAETSVPQVVEMRVDRPFVFAIRERLAGTVLFLGIVNVLGEPGG